MPGDPPTESDLDYSKSRGHEGISPVGRREKGSTAEQHQAQTHYRNNAHRKRPASNDGGSI
jgi:hypothetical protein